MGWAEGRKLPPRRRARTVALLSAAAALCWLTWGAPRLPGLYDNYTTGPPFARRADTKYILLWNDYFHFPNLGFGPGEGGAAFSAAGCPQSACYMTKDRSLMAPEHFDAVVLHMYYFSMRFAWLLNWGKLPPARSPAQRYIFFLLESPANCGSSYANMHHIFNWTMTYRWDSDIVHPYGVVVPRDGAVVPARGWLQAPSVPISPSLATAADASFATAQRGTKRRRQAVAAAAVRAARRARRGHPGGARREPALAAWLVSHCATQSRREEYVARLSMHMHVDVYGDCGTPWPKEDRDGFYRMLSRKYKFYLSFENSFCRDYVTEKLFNILELDVVPVVYGAANYSAVVPPHSYIDALAFETPGHLAAYLLFLARHPEEYEKFFWWKRFYEVRSNPTSTLCSLCAMLHEERPRKSYADMARWWNGADSCREPDVSLVDFAGR